jgi:hypothetical protein
LNDNVVASASSVESSFIDIGEKSRTFRLYFIAYQNKRNISCFTANCATVGSKSQTLNIFCIANSIQCFLSFIIFHRNVDAGLTNGKNINVNKIRHPIQINVNEIIAPKCGSNTPE